ncbi:MAG: hypothetical protein JNL09_07855 [Anaerolineales bacterium]|nr:hypothetical protein [Anaerolineales bacterium]
MTIRANSWQAKVPPENRSPSPRFWASISLVTGGLWLIFSLLPTVITTILGLPFAAITFALGVWSRRAARREADGVGVRRATWGLSLGCLGCAWQMVAITLLIIALFYGLPPMLNSLIDYLREIPSIWQQGTPTP